MSNSRTRRVTISCPLDLYADIERIRLEDRFSTMSGYIQHLMRQAAREASIKNEARSEAHVKHN